MFHILFFAITAFAPNSHAADKIAQPALETTHEAIARNDNCLQPEGVKYYSDGEKVTKMLSNLPKKSADSLDAVSKALESGGFIEDDQAVDYTVSESKLVGDKEKRSDKEFMLPDDLDHLDLWLRSNKKFINLKDCPYWDTRLDHARDIPKGAIVLYRKVGGGPVAAVEIATKAGFWSDKPRATKTFRDPNKLEVIGVYIQPEY